MHTQKLLYLIALAYTLATSCHAADRIDTDGPDFVDSAEAVGKNRFQIEQDFVSERDRRNTMLRQTFSTPTLLRYGVSESVELRLQGDTHIREITRSSGIDMSVAGHGNLGMGLKWHSQDLDQAKNTPAVSWIVQMDTPTGSNDFRGRGTRASLRSIIAWDLSHQNSLAVMPGLVHDSRADGHGFTSAVLGINYGKIFTDNFRMFVESSTSQVARAANGGVVSAWDIGAAYLLTNDWQLGGRFAVAANRNSPSNAIVVELAGRF